STPRGEGGGEFGGQSRLAFREIGGLLGVGIVFVLGAAFFADRFVAGIEGGVRLSGEFSLKDREDDGAEEFLVHGDWRPARTASTECKRSAGKRALMRVITAWIKPSGQLAPPVIKTRRGRSKLSPGQSGRSSVWPP